MCLNSKSKTKCLKLPSKYNDSAQILVFYCGNMFQSYQISSCSHLLHDETGTHSELPQKIETGCNT